MYRLLFYFLISLLFISCVNNNKITIINNAQEQITFNFRASQTPVASGSNVTIKDIPNGTYLYSTIFTLPAGATSWTTSGNAGSGSLTFLRNQTTYMIIYSSTLIDGVYTLYSSVSSTDTVSSGHSITGP
jgi:hypothetical protein